MIGTRHWVVPFVLALAMGCAAPQETPPPVRPSVAPTTQPSARLELDPADVKPMYRELLPIDLATVARVATAKNLDIQQAKNRVEAQRGRYESSVGALFPVIAPTIAFQHLEGVNQNASGTLVDTNFNNIVPAIALQWMLNPGRAVYDIVAAKKRLAASRQQEVAAELDTLRRAAIQYYELVLAQAKLAVARQSVAEAQEALRLTGLRIRAGTALSADEMRSKAFLAARQQDFILAVNAFYQASVDLTVTLRLDPTVTLVPQRQIEQTALVKDDLSIDELMGMALTHRPDLQAARTLLLAAKNDKSGTVWAGLGPQLQAGYSYGGLQTTVGGDTTALHEQQKGSASAGFALGASTFGQVKTADANVRSAAMDVERQIDQVRAQVVSAQQSSVTSAQLLPIAHEQLESADEALRLAQTNLKSGTMLLLDVLQAQNDLDGARLRHANAVVRYNQSQLNLLAALGLLEVRHVAPPVDPATMPATPPASAPAATQPYPSANAR